MDPETAKWLGGGMVILALQQVAGIVKSVVNGMSSKKKKDSPNSTNARIAVAIEKLAEAQIQDSEKLTRLDQSHHGQFAYDEKNRLRWHGGENTDETRKVGEQIQELRRETKGGHEAIVTAIEAHGSTP